MNASISLVQDGLDYKNKELVQKMSKKNF